MAAGWERLAVLDGQGSTEEWANGGTVALLDGRQLDERSLAVLDGNGSTGWANGVAGRESAELAHAGVARQAREFWIGIQRR